MQAFPLDFHSAVKEDPEVANENSDDESEAEELQDKVKTQGAFKMEDEEQDLKVCEQNCLEVFWQNFRAIVVVVVNLHVCLQTGLSFP